MINSFSNDLKNIGKRALARFVYAFFLASKSCASVFFLIALVILLENFLEKILFLNLLVQKKL